jgi:hypothetical protein
MKKPYSKSDLNELEKLIDDYLRSFPYDFFEKKKLWSKPREKRVQRCRKLLKVLTALHKKGLK